MRERDYRSEPSPEMKEFQKLREFHEILNQLERIPKCKLKDALIERIKTQMDMSSDSSMSVKSSSAGIDAFLAGFKPREKPPEVSTQKDDKQVGFSDAGDQFSSQRSGLKQNLLALLLWVVIPILIWLAFRG